MQLGWNRALLSDPRRGEEKEKTVSDHPVQSVITRSANSVPHRTRQRITYLLSRISCLICANNLQFTIQKSCQKVLEKKWNLHLVDGNFSRPLPGCCLARLEETSLLSLVGNEIFLCYFIERSISIVRLFHSATLARLPKVHLFKAAPTTRTQFSSRLRAHT